MTTKEFTWRVVGCLAAMLLLAPLAGAQETADAVDVLSVEMAAAPELGEGAASAAPDVPAVSPVEEHIRKGIALFKQNLFNEALTEFNRALAMDPGNALAREFAAKCEAKLLIDAAGADPSAVPQFQRYNPGDISPAEETPQLTADEIKRQRVRDLEDWGKQYLEAQ
jgi:tetratricopeptide (TPR) repeat protein